MKSSSNQKTDRHLSDINYYLEKLAIRTNTLQLDYNRDKTIYKYCENTNEEVGIVQKLLRTTDLSLPTKIATNVNALFIKDENLSIVNVRFVNLKRSFNPSAIAFIEITT